MIKEQAHHSLCPLSGPAGHGQAAACTQPLQTQVQSAITLLAQQKPIDPPGFLLGISLDICSVAQ